MVVHHDEKLGRCEIKRSTGFDAVHPHHALIDSQFVRRAHKNNLQVNVWTVDKADDVARMCDFGVDTVIINDVEASFEGVKRHQNTL